MLRSRFTRLAKWLAILTGITLLSFSCLLLLEAPTYSRDQNLILASQSLQLTPSELSQLSLKDSSNYLTLQAPLYSTSYHRSNNELDVVISYHTESLSVLKATITSIVAFLKDSDPRFIIYNKNSKIDSKKLLQATGADAVISLENVGREGQTYLRHILDHYDSSTGGEDHSSEGRGPLSSKTLFMQPHIEAPYVNVPLKGGRFPYLARQRLASMKSDTGFMNLAGFSVSFCGRSSDGGKLLPQLKSIYELIHGRECPPEGFAAPYRAEFSVSRKRILNNPKKLYEDLEEMLVSPEKSSIFKSGGEGSDFLYNGWVPTGSDPFAGHLLERSWATLFQCDNPLLAKFCGDNVLSGLTMNLQLHKDTLQECQCRD